jgi:PAS domain S-box-containing protein
MNSPIRVLLVEDVAEDAELLTRELRKGQLEVVIHRVDTEPELRDALSRFDPHVILSDYNLPAFGGPRALEVAQQHSPDVPFIFVSGTIGEERAIEALHHGAVDYVLKDNRARLVPAVRRALNDAAERESRRRAERQLAVSEERFSSLADATQEWIWELDVAGVHTFCNPAVSKILGFAPEELVGSTALAFVDDSDRQAAHDMVVNAVAEKRGWRDVVLRWRHRGRQHPLSREHRAAVVRRRRRSQGLSRNGSRHHAADPATGKDRAAVADPCGVFRHQRHDRPRARAQPDVPRCLPHRRRAGRLSHGVGRHDRSGDQRRLPPSPGRASVPSTFTGSS